MTKTTTCDECGITVIYPVWGGICTACQAVWHEIDNEPRGVSQ